MCIRDSYHAQQVIEKYQVTPPQIIELKALMGDSADNIPGIPGVGEKTATKIIVEYGSIENAHEHLEAVSYTHLNGRKDNYSGAAEVWKKADLYFF